MAGRHRTTAGRHRQCSTPPRRRLVQVVNARTLTAHFLTPDAYAAGLDVHVPYVAICGEPVLPASLTEPGGGYCTKCRTSVPAQRSAGA
jgi:hypothetical protein